jgi:hypothetical protein
MRTLSSSSRMAFAVRGWGFEALLIIVTGVRHQLGAGCAFKLRGPRHGRKVIATQKAVRRDSPTALGDHRAGFNDRTCSEHADRIRT